MGEVVGIDLQTFNNWLRRGIINGSPVGGRQLRTRLFSEAGWRTFFPAGEIVKDRIRGV